MVDDDRHESNPGDPVLPVHDDGSDVERVQPAEDGEYVESEAARPSSDAIEREAPASSSDGSDADVPLPVGENTIDRE
jgi:hypothetical protein